MNKKQILKKKLLIKEKLKLGAPTCATENCSNKVSFIEKIPFYKSYYKKYCDGCREFKVNEIVSKKRKIKKIEIDRFGKHKIESKRKFLSFKQ